MQKSDTSLHETARIVVSNGIKLNSTMNLKTKIPININNIFKGFILYVCMWLDI